MKCRIGGASVQRPLGHGFKVHLSRNHVKRSGGVIGVADCWFSAGEASILVRLRKINFSVMRLNFGAVQYFSLAKAAQQEIGFRL